MTQRPISSKPVSFWLVATFTLFVNSNLQRCHAQQTGPAAIVNVNVIDVVSGALHANQTLMVSEGKITDIADQGKLNPAADATVIDGAGKYLIPGMWDMHVHHEFPWTGLLDLAVVNGVTGVRDLNSEPFVLKWRDEINADKRVGPRIIASGKYLDAKLNGQPPTRVSADTAAQAVALVRERKSQNVDFIKVYTGLAPEVYKAIIAEAAAQKLPVAGHCPELVPAMEASKLGQRSIEHLSGIAISSSSEEDAIRSGLPEAAFNGPYGYDIDLIIPLVERAMNTTDPEKQQRLFATLKANKTWQTPTLVTQRRLPPNFDSEPRMRYIHVGVVQLWNLILTHDKKADYRAASADYARQTVRAMHKAGVPLMVGTDAGGSININVYPGFSVADELVEFVACGLSPLQALQCATINPAQYLNEADRSGQIAPGMRADLVLLDDNPIDDIANVRKIAGVMVYGKWLDRAELDRMLEQIAKSTGR